MPITFIVGIKPGNPATGQKTSTASWESALDVPLTTAKVFAISSIGVGGPDDGAAVTGRDSTATGTLATHTDSAGNQALIHTITGTFTSGEIVEQDGATTQIFTIDDAGDTPGEVRGEVEVGSSDDTSIPQFSGATVDATSFRRVIPKAGQEHIANFDSGKYVLDITTSSSIGILEDFFIMEGVQIFKHNTSSGGQGNVVTLRNDETAIRKCIIQIDTPNAGTILGIRTDTTGSGEKRYIDRNILYEATKSTSSTGIRTDTGAPAPDVIVYKNIVYNFVTGFNLSTAARLKNNIAQGNTTDYADSPGTSANNISEDASSPDAAFRSKVVTFVDEGSDDFRLDTADTVAKDLGTTLDPDPDGFLNITEDIVGTSMPQGSDPDIGAFEVLVADTMSSILGTGLLYDYLEDPN